MVRRMRRRLLDTDRLCEFPEGTSSKVVVTLQDYRTLQYSTFLNDIVIDFYLTYLYETYLTEEFKATVHIFSTMFYERLLRRGAGSFEEDKSLNSVQKRHQRVAGWTKAVDLLEKDMIIFPICEHSHWYLVIAIKPRLVTKSKEDWLVLGEPYFLVLDSMGEKHGLAVTIIQGYLDMEWRAKRGSVSNFHSSNMRVVTPVKPEQHNTSDCGIYLLHYVEKIFISPPSFHWPETAATSLAAWFPLEEVAAKRGDLARLIRVMAEEQGRGQQALAWPNLNFLDPLMAEEVLDNQEEVILCVCQSCQL